MAPWMGDSGGGACPSLGTGLPLVRRRLPFASFSPASFFFSTLLKNFWAWLRTCTAVLVPMCSARGRRG
jgi:hypothetical protein